MRRISIAVLLLCAIPAFVLIRQCSKYPNLKANRDALLQVYAQVSPGQSEATFLQIVAAYQQYLKLDQRVVSEYHTLWTAGTPSSWNAKNWQLYVDTVDSKVYRMRVRTRDSINEQPKGSPPDKLILPSVN